MKDPFKDYQDMPNHPGRNFFTVVPDDDADLPIVPKALICDTAGDLVLVGENGTEVTIAVDANVVYPFAPQRVKATGHSAGVVVALC